MADFPGKVTSHGRVLTGFTQVLTGFSRVLATFSREFRVSTPGFGGSILYARETSPGSPTSHAGLDRSKYAYCNILVRKSNKISLPAKRGNAANGFACAARSTATGGLFRQFVTLCGLSERPFPHAEFGLSSDAAVVRWPFAPGSIRNRRFPNALDMRHFQRTARSSSHWNLRSLSTVGSALRRPSRISAKS